MIDLTQNDLPHPVVPAISKFGTFEKLIYSYPPNYLPIQKQSSDVLKTLTNSKDNIVSSFL